MKNGVLFVLVCVVSLAVGWLSHLYISNSEYSLKDNDIPVRTVSSSDASRWPTSVKDEVQAESKRLDRLLLSIDSKSKLKTVLNGIIGEDKKQNFKGNEWDVVNPTLRLYGMASDIFLKLEGAAYRLRDIVEMIMPAYLSAVSSLRGTKYYLSHFPKHLGIGFDFLVDPNPESEIFGHKGKFTSYAQLRDYLNKNFVPELEELSKNVAALADKFSNEVIWVTNIEAIFGREKASEIFGYSQKRGGESHFKKALLGSHLNGAVAWIYQTLGSGTYALSFHIDGAQDYVNKMMVLSYNAGQTRRGKVINWALNNKIPSPREVKSTIDKVRKKKSRFLTLTDRARREDSLGQAQNYYLKAVDFDRKHHLALFDQAKSLENPTAYIINPKEIAREEHHIMYVLNTRSELLNSNGPVDVEIPATREKITVDVSKAFDGDSFGDLVAFYPVCFYGDKPSRECPISNPKMERHGQTEESGEINTHQFVGRKFLNENFKWNYLYGRPEYWPNPSFNGLFPGATQKNVVEQITKFSSAPYLPSLGMLLTFFR